MCPKHFVKFLVSDFLFDDAPWLGRPVEHDSKKIETVLENNQQYTMWEIVNILKISNLSVKNHLHQLGYVHHFDVWVSHK